MTKKYTYIFLVLLLAIFVLQAAPVVWYQSPTFDEPNWVNIAWYLTHYWTWQADYHVLMHPPLSFYLHGIPLRLYEWWNQNASTSPPEGALAARFPYPYSAILKYDAVFTIAKLSILPMSVILGWYIFAWAARLYGASAGLFAALLYVANPYMLAYATIITSDLLVACFIFIAAYHFWRFSQQPSTVQMVLSGVMLGLALLSKASAVFLFPIFLLLWLCLFLKKRFSRNDGDHAGILRLSAVKVCVSMGIIFAIGLFVLEAGYLFDMQPVRSFHPTQNGDLVYRLFKDIPIPWGAHINSLRLHQSFVLSMSRHHFFAGQHSTEPIWYYHLATLILKNPVALLIFLGLSFASLKTMRGWLHRENFLLLPIAFFFIYFSFFFPLSISSRFAFPMYPFLFVFASRIVTFDLFKRLSARMVLAMLLLWYVASSAAVFPHYLAYCNELIGGTENGYKWFADSSYDWGQDLKGLGEYMRRNRIPTIKLAYFGTAIPEYYGINYTKLAEPDGCRPTKALIAISATTLQGVYAKNQNCYDWLKQYEPIDKIGYSMFIYLVK